MLLRRLGIAPMTSYRKVATTRRSHFRSRQIRSELLLQLFLQDGELVFLPGFHNQLPLVTIYDFTSQPVLEESMLQPLAKL